MGNHQFEEEVCLLFYMSRDLPEKTQSGFKQKDSPDIIKGLTPYQILGKLTSQTHKKQM